MWGTLSEQGVLGEEAQYKYCMSMPPLLQAKDPSRWNPPHQKLATVTSVIQYHAVNMTVKISGLKSKWKFAYFKRIWCI